LQPFELILSKAMRLSKKGDSKKPQFRKHFSIKARFFAAQT